MVDFTKKENRAGTTPGVPSSNRAKGAQAATYDEGLRSYMLRVYNTMGMGLAVTGLVAYFTYSSGLMFQLMHVMWLLMIAEVGLVIYFSVRLNAMSEMAAKGVFYAYSALNGLTFSVLFAVYTHESLGRVFFITAAMFGAMSVWGYTTKKNLTGMGHFMLMGLFGIIIASLVNLFLHSPAIYYATSALSVVNFTGLTAYDTQRIREVYYLVGRDNVGRAAISGALTLYLDFINLMLTMLRLMGDRR